MMRLSAAVALIAAAALCLVGLTYGTWAVGGSDSSCYALMADAFAHGALQPTTELARDAPWPDAARTFAPAGFIPSPVIAGAASPICAPGFSLLLAPFRWAGGADAIFVVAALSGALLVVLTFLFTTQLAGPFAGAAAAIIVATTPVVLFQVVQPMNDITVTAIWMGILVAGSAQESRRSWLLGALTGLALLVRPNLAPAAAVVGVWLVLTRWTGHGWARVGGTGQSRPAPSLRRCVCAFTIGAAPFLVTLFWLNTALYGHPLQSGYGSAGDLFSLRHVLPNVRNYGQALLQTQLGVPLLGVAAIFVVAPPVRAVVWLTLGISVSVASVYLLYRPFNEWWYLRFLLPALAPMTALGVVVLVQAIGGAERAQPRWRMLAAATAVAACALFGVITARDRQAFDLQRLERRFRLTGELVRDRLPDHAAFITVWESGTLRYHADRTSVLWDSLDPAALEKAIAWLAAQGLDPYIVAERWEEPLVRARFSAHTPLGNLDWPPRFDIDRQVRVFKPADRALYVQGGIVPTEYVFGR